MQSAYKSSTRVFEVPNEAAVIFTAGFKTWSACPFGSCMQEIWQMQQGGRGLCLNHDGLFADLQYMSQSVVIMCKLCLTLISLLSSWTKLKLLVSCVSQQCWRYWTIKQASNNATTIIAIVDDNVMFQYTFRQFIFSGPFRRQGFSLGSVRSANFQQYVFGQGL